MGRGEMELLETVISRNLPEEFHGSYEGDFGKNYMYNYFNELDSKQTRWIAEIEYIEMKGFMMNVMKTLFPKTFQKQTQKWLNQFKTWAESKAVAT